MADRNVRVTLRMNIAAYLAALKAARESGSPDPNARDYRQVERDDG